ncbi:RNA-directed RNA polymerase (Sad-1) [Emericellopsis cladophorae]|uniref:D-lactate dehydrogenase (cytochrome) n=1 Tax=Emericellopsis cladophorae TaxID=2686198 RepID=A0A9Q0B889_9HYPO|nr:RNA-directed RNA polymerase (Sad-1) [Emericellopsis cladophorae]KAI6777857.1 RNA-directed RNA polymerase (Sad-1) [Emericellopsis cladophorae]
MRGRTGLGALLRQSSRSQGTWRSFSSNSARLSTKLGGVGARQEGASSSWSTRGVLAVAGTAGVLGWGIAQVSKNGEVNGKPAKVQKPRYATVKEMEKAIQKIAVELGDEDIISTDPEDLHRHGYSEWSTVNPDTLPVAVAYPHTTEQVSTIARICHEHRIPIIPYSGGTSLEGNFTAPYGGVSVDFAFMDKIVEFNKDDMDVVVQPSIGWQDLNQQLADMDSGLFFPVDPGPTAKIGGMIGTNCSGTNAVRYGTMKDWVINLTVVLADGRVIKTRRRPRKCSAGYNLNSLFVGSEGTLGLVTEATLKLAIVPEDYAVAVVSFPSIRDAASAAAGVMQAGVPVAAMEVMDEVQMMVINKSGATAPLTWDELPTLFFKFSGTKAAVKEHISLVDTITKSNKGGNFQFAKDAAEQKLLWSARKESLWSMLSLRQGDEDVWSTDVAVPFSRLADIIEVSKKEMDDLGLFASILGHIGDGNFHESIMYNKKDPAERAKVEACVKNMVKRALNMEGTCTGEHGIGWGKKESLFWEVGPEVLSVMGAIKSALDPLWLMNPGKIMDVPGMENKYNRNHGVMPVRATAKSAGIEGPLVEEELKEQLVEVHGGTAVASSSSLKTVLSSNPYIALYTTPAYPLILPIQHVGSMPWQKWPSLTLELTRLPKNTETRHLWKWFSREGNIVHLQVMQQDERRSSSRAPEASVRFEPPPSRNFWNNGEYTVTHPQENTAVRIKILPPRQDAQQWSYGPFSLDTAGNIIRMTGALGHQHPMLIALKPTGIDFGVMTGPNTMNAMKRATPMEEEPLVLELDTRHRKLCIQFPHKARFRHQSRNTPNGPIIFRVEVNLAQIKTAYQLRDPNGMSTSLVLPLTQPPQYFWRNDDLGITMADAGECRWGRQDIWYRATHIAGDMTINNRYPISVNEAIPDSEHIDIGRWTCFRFVLDTNDATNQLTRQFKSVLEDFNVQYVEHLDLEVKSGLKAPMWAQVDHPPSRAAASHSEALASLGMQHVFDIDFAVRYQLEVCISKGLISDHNITEEFLQKLSIQYRSPDESPNCDPSRARQRLEWLVDQNIRLEDPMTIFTNPDAGAFYTSNRLPHYCTLVRKAVVTPTTIHFSTPVAETSNRVMRKYDLIQDRFLRVQFLDEGEQGRIGIYRPQNKALYTRLERTLYQGVQIGDRRYEFLAFGSSQLRECGAYFFCPTESVSCDDIRRWMGSFDHIKIVAKYAARLGQCFSTTREIKGIQVPHIVRVPDIERNGYCFSDGVGIISPFLARLIVQEVDMDAMSANCSAFQFRMGGCKGVLTVWPEAKGMEVHIRNSQEKFTTSFHGLEIIRCARLATATLNRQTISILECLGVPTGAFMNLLDDQMRKFEAALGDKQENKQQALSLLTQFVDENQTTLIMAEFLKSDFIGDGIREPFVASILNLWRAWSLKLLKEKARIHVPQSAFVLGCLDETGTLRGHRTAWEKPFVKQQARSYPKQERTQLPEIFLQLSDPKVRNKSTVVEGICIVGRNPSLHPGDIRVVRAVNVEKLQHLRDVVVFPSTGDRPLPNMLSGGDLDGDDYFVIWDQSLIPKEWHAIPMSFETSEPKVEDKVTVDDLRDFFVSYIQNDVLPLVAVAHLGQSDAQKEGPKSARCLSLAEKHSLAVDFPKTGVPVGWSTELQPKQWPHFMEKKSRYQSQKTLGKIYDKVQAHAVHFQPDWEDDFDRRILGRYEFEEETLDAARNVKKQYDTAVHRVLAQHKVKTEFELWTGFAMSRPVIGSDYKRQEHLGKEYDTLRHRFRDMCYTAAGGHGPEKIDPFVAAMYKVTEMELKQTLEKHRESMSDDLANGTLLVNTMDASAIPLVTFPWIFPQVMIRIAQGTAKSKMHSKAGTHRETQQPVYKEGNTKAGRGRSKTEADDECKPSEALEIAAGHVDVKPSVILPPPGPGVVDMNGDMPSSNTAANSDEDSSSAHKGKAMSAYTTSASYTVDSWHDAMNGEASPSDSGSNSEAECEDGKASAMDKLVVMGNGS